MREVAAVAMTKQHHGARLLVLDEPTVKMRAVRCREPGVFNGEIGGRPMTFWIGRRMIEQTVLPARPMTCAANGRNARATDQGQTTSDRQWQHGSAHRPGPPTISRKAELRG